MKPLTGYSTLGVILLILTIFLVNSCEVNDPTHQDTAALIGDWEMTSFLVDENERMDAIFTNVEMQFDAAGSAVWIFTDLRGNQESVSGKFDIYKGSQTSTLSFIDPEFSMVISDTLYLSGISESGKEYFIKSIKK